MTPALQTAMSKLTLPKGWEVTSLISGPHKGWGHPNGAAVDIAGPKSRAAWSWIVAQIKSGKWKEIGSTSDVSDDEAMKALASKYGVNLFNDEGTGFHVHLQVEGPL